MRAEGIEKRFDNVWAVRGVSFAAHRGEVLALLGPNGAGKTTIIRMIIGILRPDRGRIRFLFGGREGPLDRRRVGYLPEERGLYEDARVLDTLVYLAELKGIPRATARRRALEWLGRFGLENWAHRRMEKLSKGMQQKVQFLAAILHEPELVVLDEPFAGLDPVNQELVRDLILRLREKGSAVLLSSHRMDLVEGVCDRVLFLHRGRAVLHGEVEEVRARWGRHRVELRFRGDPVFLKGNALVQGLELRGNLARFSLPQGVRPVEFVRSLPAEAELEEMIIRRPSLHEIFVDVAGGRREAGDGNP